MMSSPDPRPALPSGAVTYRMLRELGARSPHSYAAMREPSELVVAQRFVRVRLPAAAIPSPSAPPLSAPPPSATPLDATPLDATSMALLLRDARCLAKNWHPNIGRVRHVDLVGSELTIASELIDGATLADLVVDAAAARTSSHEPLLPFPILVRILLDVLAGLHALHGLRDGINAPLGAVHGELSPASIVVGKDGVARIIDVLRPRPVRLERPSPAAGYAAPEALEAGGTSDPRSDVYAVGVILWEALTARRLYDESQPARVLARQRAEEVVCPHIHPSSPFARLVEVAMRALAFEPALRFRGPAEMSAELRKVAGAHLAAGSAIAAAVTDLAGERIRTRRSLLDPALSGMRRRVSERSILAAKAAVRERESARDLAAPARNEAPERPSGPALARPDLRRSGMIKGSPRVVAPTARAEVSPELLGLSRKTSPDRDLQDEVIDAQDIETVYDEDARPLVSRGSSPEVDVEAALLTKGAAAAEATRPRPALSPAHADGPSSRLPDGSSLRLRLVAPSRRAPEPLVASTVMQGASETPGELVVPVAAHGARTERRSSGALLLMTALVVVLASGASVTLRVRATRAASRAAAQVARRPVVVLAAAPAATETARTLPEAVGLPDPPSPVVAPRPELAAPALASLAAPARPPVTPAAPPTLRATRAQPPPPAPPPPPAKPKRSVYDPEGL